jgi:hypothetical protein
MADDRTPEQKKANAQEAKAIKAILKSYNTARTFDKDARKAYAQDRLYASGKANPEWAVDANMIGTFIDILVSFLFAKAPDISAQPGEQVGRTPDEDAELFADTMRIVIRRLWKDAKLKKAVRKALRSSLSIGPGWIKSIMVTQSKNDPIVEKDLNDAQDNMARLLATRKEIKEDEGLTEDEMDVKVQAAELLTESLTNKLEVIIRRGLALDFVRGEDVQVSLDVSELSDYLNANWLANQMFVEKDDVRGMFPRLTADDMRDAKIYYQRKVNDEPGAIAGQITADHAEKFTQSTETSGDEIPFVRVIEFWDKRDGHIKTITDGVKRWAREPYQPPHATTRFYPYFLIALFEVDGDRHPQSLSGRLDKLQDEYASTRSAGRLARSRSIPGTIFDAGVISPDDIVKIEGAVEQEYVGIQPIAGGKLSDAFAEKPVGKYDPRIYDTSQTVRDMETISGVQEALRQSGGQKTATEANIEQAGFASRTGADRDTQEDMLTDLAQYTAELAIQALPYEYVAKIAGDLAFWPEGLDFEDVVTQINLDIEAGSTGAPNKEQERQSWSVVMPLIRETMVIIQQAQATGNIPLAEALTELLEETLQRMGDRTNLDRFLPKLAATPTGAVPMGDTGGQATPQAAGQQAPTGTPTA